MSDLARARLELQVAIQSGESAELALILWPYGTGASRAEREALAHIRTGLIELRWALRLADRIEHPPLVALAPSSPKQ